MARCRYDSPPRRCGVPAGIALRPIQLVGKQSWHLGRSLASTRGPRWIPRLPYRGRQGGPGRVVWLRGSPGQRIPGQLPAAPGGPGTRTRRRPGVRGMQPEVSWRLGDVGNGDRLCRKAWQRWQQWLSRPEMPERRHGAGAATRPERRFRTLVPPPTHQPLERLRVFGRRQARHAAREQGHQLRLLRGLQALERALDHRLRQSPRRGSPGPVLRP